MGEMAHAMATLAKLTFCGTAPGAAEAIKRSCGEACKGAGFEAGSALPIKHKSFKKPNRGGYYGFITTAKKVTPGTPPMAEWSMGKTKVDTDMPEESCVLVFRGEADHDHIKDALNSSMEFFPNGAYTKN